LADIGDSCLIITARAGRAGSVGLKACNTFKQSKCTVEVKYTNTK